MGVFCCVLLTFPVHGALFLASIASQSSSLKFLEGTDTLSYPLSYLTDPYMQMLFPSQSHFLLHSKGTPSKKRNLLTRIQPLAHIPSQGLPLLFPLLHTQSLPPRPQQQQPPQSLLDPCRHQPPVVQRASPARQTDVPTVRVRRRKVRSTPMGPRYHPRSQNKILVRDEVPVGLSPSHKAWTIPLQLSHRPRLISTQMTCSLSGRNHPHHEAYIQTRNLGSQVLRVGFWTSVFMYPRVLSVPRVGQSIHSGRHTYVGTLGERSNAKCR